MKRGEIEVCASMSNFRRYVDLVFMIGMDQSVLATPTVDLSRQAMIEYDGASAWPETLHMEVDTAQSLIDALWAVGLRPSQHDVGGPAQVVALQNHLKDMRKLVFDHTVFVKPNARLIGPND